MDINSINFQREIEYLCKYYHDNLLGYKCTQKHSLDIRLIFILTWASGGIPLVLLYDETYSLLYYIFVR